MGAAQHLVTGARVVGPVLDRRLVDRADLPLAERIVPAFVQPLDLLGAVDVEIIFEQPDAGVDEHTLEDRRVVEKGLCLFLGAEAHDPLDAGPVVPGPVEQHELGGRWQMRDVALKVLDRLVDATADDIRTRRALDQKPCLRGFTETSYQAKSWSTDRRACARIEATTKGLDIRFVVTSIETGAAEHIYGTLYCARGQAENLIKFHKAQLASDRTSCRSPLANQMRLILHTAAYWLTLTVRDAIPATHALATAEFNTIRLRLLKL